MKRRDFIRTGVEAGLLSGAFPLFGGLDFIQGQPFTDQYDLAAVRGGQPEEMFERAIDAMGGMNHYVKKGQKVLVKPNIGWDAPPERAANTNPRLIKRIIEHCFNAGASEVYVFDHTCNKWDRCYKNSGIEAMVKSAGEKWYRATQSPSTGRLAFREVKGLRQRKYIIWCSTPTYSSMFRF